MNKCRATKNDLHHFNDFFSQQYKSIIVSNVLPVLNLRTAHITIQSNAIMSFIRNLNPNKANGPDGISGQMLLLCDTSVLLPLKKKKKKALSKYSGETSCNYKGDKQLIKYYRPISLLQIYGKIFEKI